MIKQILIILLLNFICTALQAKEIHVSINGNDSNDGSLKKPFRTISQASRLAMPGTVVIVHAGVYREQITPPRGGYSDKERIVYRAAEGEKVEIRGSEIIKGWQKLNNNTWSVSIPNSFFGKFNPYSDLIHGDWFWPTPASRKYHTGAVYLNGDWLMEAERKEQVLGNTDLKNLLWWAETDSLNTTIFAQFGNADPNREMVEINVRQTIFYPDKPFVNYISISGFSMQHAATNWAPPTAGQMGLVGTGWSRGWIIEDNIIQYSKCVGIALGKYSDSFDNKNTESAEGYIGTINRALAFGWNRDSVGGHIVRNNTIAYCEQAGIVGSLGCSFSTVTGNTIHDIYVKRLFSGAEMAGIKFHGAVDVKIEGNHIYSVNIGIWLDWMAQGAQMNRNLMHANLTDIYLEVNHGPMLISNNILLSPDGLVMNSSGAAVVNNLFSGRIDALYYDARLTPYLKPHSTSIEKLADNAGGDVQFYNNLFVNGSNASQYSKALQPVIFDGNVFTKDCVRPTADSTIKKNGEMNDAGREKLRNSKPYTAYETNSIDAPDFNSGLKLLTENGSVYLEINLSSDWCTAQKRRIITSSILGKALVPGLPFENPDGSAIVLDEDYWGKQRNESNLSPSPFEISKSGKQKIRVW